MAWLRIDDEFVENDKIAELHDRAFRFHVAALCYCARKLTDGHMDAKATRIVAATLGTPAKRWVEELVAAGLWVPTNDGHVINDYLDYNPSRQTVLAERERGAARQRDHKQRVRNEIANSLSNAEGNAVTDTVTDTVTNDAPNPNPYPMGLPTSVSYMPKVSTGHETRTFPDQIRPLVTACRATGDDIAKLERAARGRTTAEIVAACEAATGPGVRDRLAVALATLKKRKAAA